MKDDGLFTALIGVVCAVGVASRWEAADRFLSTAFAWMFGAGGVLLALGWLVREAWDVVQDWRWMGPPDIGPWRRQREMRETDEEVRPQ